VDEIAVDLAPVVLGRGVAFFTTVIHAPVLLDDAEVVEGVRVTQLFSRPTSRTLA